MATYENGMIGGEPTEVFPKIPIWKRDPNGAKDALNIRRDAILMMLISEWEPDEMPRCNNCSNCRVRRSPDERVIAICRVRPELSEANLAQLIRPRAPRGLASATLCPSFDPAEDFPVVKGWKGASTQTS